MKTLCVYFFTTQHPFGLFPAVHGPNVEKIPGAEAKATLLILLALICISAVIWAICHIVNNLANSPDKIIKNKCGFFYDFAKNGTPIHDEHGKKQWADGFTIKTTINGNQNYHFLDVNINLHIKILAKNLITEQYEWVSYTDTLTLSQKGSGSSEFVIQQIAKGGTCYCLTEASTAVVSIVSVKGLVVKKQ